MRKMVILFLVFILIGGGLAFSGAREPDREDVVLWMPGDEARWLMGSDLPSMFEEAYPEYRLRIAQYSWDALHDRLVAGFAGAELPDVTWGADHWVGHFVELDGLMQLEGFKERKGYTDDEFLPGAWDHFVSLDGNLYGAPAIMDARILFYRSDILEEAGIAQPPETLDELIEIGNRLSDPPNRFALAHQGSWLDYHFFSWLVYAHGGDLVSPEKCYLTEPETIEALEYYALLYNENIMPKDPASRVETFAGFKEGYYAMAKSGPWWIGLLRDQAPELAGIWKAAVLPSGKTTVSYGHPNPLLIPAEANNVAGAEAWIDFFLSAEIQTEWHMISGNLPVRAAAYEDPRLSEDPTVQVFQKAADRGTNSMRNITNAEAVSETIWVMLENVRDDRMTPQEAAANACQQIERLLRE